eukprot:1953997-Pyramimonas_sp.AAC.1
MFLECSLEGSPGGGDGAEHPDQPAVAAGDTQPRPRCAEVTPGPPAESSRAKRASASYYCCNV